MAFKTSNALFDSIFGEDTKTPSEEFMDDLIAYLRSKASIPGTRELADWLAAKKPTAVLACRDELVAELSEELLGAGIPYVIICDQAGHCGFLFRDIDLNAVSATGGDILNKHSKTCKLVTGKKLMHLAAAKGIKERTVLVLSGLSFDRVQLLAEKYGRAYNNAVMGIDRMRDGSRTVTIFGNGSIRNADQEAVDINRIFLEMAVETGGPNGPKNKALAGMRANFAASLATNFENTSKNMNTSPVWVIGSGRQYMKITGYGFEYGRVLGVEDDLKLLPEYKADVVQPDYRQQLISYANRIPDKLTTLDPTELMQHFAEDKSNAELDKLDISKSAVERLQTQGEKQLCALLDYMIMIKLQGDPAMQMEGHWDAKFKAYMREARELITALAAGRFPKEYSKETIDKLTDIMKRYRLDPAAYRETIQLLQNAEAVTLTNEIERIADVEKVLAGKREEELLRQEQERAERAAARGRRGGKERE